MRRVERGAALLIALGGLALIGALAAAALTLTTGPATRAAAAVERATAERAAEAAIHRLALAFTLPAERNRAPRDGTVIETNFEGAALVISAQDALGLINVNLSDAPTLSRLLVHSGADPADADELAETWVTTREGLGRNGFATLSAAAALARPELQDVVETTLDHATIWSGAPGVDPTVATAPALAAAANVPLDVAQAFVARRTLDGPRTPLPPEVNARTLRRSDGRVARVSVRVETPGGGRASLSVVMERTTSPRRPIIFHAWR